MKFLLHRFATFSQSESFWLAALRYIREWLVPTGKRVGWQTGRKPSARHALPCFFTKIGQAFAIEYLYIETRSCLCRLIAVHLARLVIALPNFRRTPDTIRPFRRRPGIVT